MTVECVRLLVNALGMEWDEDQFIRQEKQGGKEKCSLQPHLHACPSLSLPLSLSLSPSLSLSLSLCVCVCVCVVPVLVEKCRSVSVAAPDKRAESVLEAAACAVHASVCLLIKVLKKYAKVGGMTTPQCFIAVHCNTNKMNEQAAGTHTDGCRVTQCIPSPSSSPHWWVRRGRA